MRKLFVIWVLFSLLISACGAKPALTPTETSRSASTASPTLGRTATSSPTQTHTPAPTSTPTQTATPRPTATPIGFYQNDTLAFSLILPAEMEVAEENDSLVYFVKDFPRLVLLGASFLDTTPVVFEDFVELYTSGSGSTYEILSRGEFSTSGGITGLEGMLKETFQGNELRTRLLIFQTGARTYLFVASGAPDDMDEMAASIENSLKTIRFHADTIAGLSRDESLVLLGYDPDPIDLDPAVQTSSADDYTGALFAGLVRLTPDLQIVPDLAESWTISPDGTIYTFNLRPGIRFQDGKPITAADFKFSWERAANPETDSPTAKTYLGDILGVKEMLAGKADEISGLKVIDERTLEVTLDASKAYFLAKLSYPTSFVVDQEDIKNDPDRWMFDPNASGPFFIHTIEPESQIIFERNANYYAPASIRYVIYQLYRVGSRLSLFSSGEVDILAISADDAELVQAADHPQHENLVSGVALCTSVIQLNNSLPPFDDANVRKAFALAVDRQRIIDVIAEGYAEPGYTILPPAMPGFSQDLESEWMMAGGFNPTLAQAALAASAYAGSMPEIRMVEGGFGESDDPFTNLLLSMWQETLGVQVKIEYVDPMDLTRAAKTANGHIVSYGWCADYPDPENFLDVLFHTGSDFNVANYSNPEVDRLLEQARTELDPLARIALYQRVEKLLLQDYATIPLQISQSYVLVSSRIQGYIFSGLGARSLDSLSLTEE